MRKFFSKKAMVWALLACWVASAPLTTFAATEIFVGGAGGYGAQINDLGGALIKLNDGTKAQLGITGNGNVINWDWLNVGAGKTLDFNFSKAGQVALNKVQTGISKFAGTVSTSGTSGHLIISNSNGMIFSNGSSINAGAGSVTLTTHDANWDGNLNGIVTTAAKPISGKTNGIELTGATITTVGDCNIISTGIRMTNADIVTAGEARLISSDGVTFTATPKNNIIKSITETQDVSSKPENVLYNGVAAVDNTDASVFLSNVKVKTAKSVSDAVSNGKLFIRSVEKVVMDGLKVGKADIKTFGTTNGGIEISNSIINGTARSIITPGSGNLFVDNSSLIKNTDLITTAIAAEIVINSSTIINSSIKTEAKETNISLFGATIENSTLSTLGESADIYVMENSNLLKGKTALNTSGDKAAIYVWNSAINNVNLATTGIGAEIGIKNSTVENSKIATIANDSKINVIESKITKSALSTGLIPATGITTGDKSDITVSSSVLENSTITTVGENASITVNGGSNLTKGKSILSTAGTSSDINVDNSAISNASLTTTGKDSKININESTMVNDKISTTADNSKINIVSSIITKSTLSTGLTTKATAQIPAVTTGDESDITISNSTLESSTVTTLGKKASIFVKDGSNLIKGKNILTTSGDTDSDINVESGSKITGAALTTNGKDGAIVVSGANTVIEKSALLTKGALTVVKDSIHVLNGAMVSGSTLTTNGENAKIAVYGVGTTIENSKLLTKGLGAEISVDDCASVKGSSMTTSGKLAHIFVKKDAEVTSGTMKTTGAGANIKVSDGVINNVTATTNGDINVTGSKLDGKTSLSAKGNMLLADNSGSGTLSLTDSGDQLIVTGLTYTGDVKIKGASKTRIEISESLDKKGSVLDLTGEVTEGNQSLFDTTLRTETGGDLRVYFDEGRAAFDLPSVITGNVTVNGGNELIVGGTEITGTLKIASTKFIGILDSVVSSGVFVGGKSLLNSQGVFVVPANTAIYKSVISKL